MSNLRNAEDNKYKLAKINMLFFAWIILVLIVLTGLLLYVLANRGIEESSNNQAKELEIIASTDFVDQQVPTNTPTRGAFDSNNSENPIVTNNSYLETVIGKSATKLFFPTPEITPIAIVTLTPTPTITPVPSPSITPTSSATVTPTPSVVPIFRQDFDYNNNIHNQKVIVVNYNPEDVATRYFSYAFAGLNVKQHEQKMVNDTINSMKTLSDGKVNYSVVHTLDINTFPTYNNGLEAFSANSYSKCTTGQNTDYEYCDARKYAFDYVKWTKENQICQLANQYDANEVWVISPPYVMTWESFMVGPTYGFNVNGGSYRVEGCDRHIIGVNPTYNRPETFLHDFGHRIESTMVSVTSNWQKADQDYYWNRFVKFENYAGEFSTELSCGNTHFPANTNVGYDYSNQSVTNFNCNDMANFPYYEDSFATINCSSWGCNDSGWQEYWLSGIPSNKGEVVLESIRGRRFTIARDWWHYILNADLVIELRNNSW